MVSYVALYSVSKTGETNLYAQTYYSLEYNPLSFVLTISAVDSSQKDKTVHIDLKNEYTIKKPVYVSNRDYYTISLLPRKAEATEFLIYTTFKGEANKMEKLMQLIRNPSQSRDLHSREEPEMKSSSSLLSNQDKPSIESPKYHEKQVKTIDYSPSKSPQSKPAVTKPLVKTTTDKSGPFQTSELSIEEKTLKVKTRAMMSSDIVFKANLIEEVKKIIQEEADTIIREEIDKCRQEIMKFIHDELQK
ncbi:hypothetical protein ADUPG1_012200 [Aduncisulcus paluster]|uniref:Major sperm protein n=1 Tax=Aduncisulcus paluster TaxID=2918883 RepID=A0ABQ5JYP8_9EUKA|nr:hypothetical protein ADUPG1_012200 [Aduncisulcus paluster]